MKKIFNKLQQFKKEHNISTKGPLCVVLVITRIAKNEGLPLDPQSLVTKKSGQVRGLGKSAVRNILKEYAITKTLASEGGRTSRGSMGIMQNYVPLLNSLQKENGFDLNEIEKWWIDRVKQYFMSKPFILSIDNTKSLAMVINSLMDQAAKRQNDNQGTMYVGALMQHLVGAKLELAVPNEKINHNGFSVADAPHDREGDFLIGNVAIHVTATPTESLIEKCKINLGKRLRPIIVTSKKGINAAEVLAEHKAIEGRVEFFELLQFISLNIYELSSFKIDRQEITIKDLVEKYNLIVETNETDPSLKIQI